MVKAVNDKAMGKADSQLNTMTTRKKSGFNKRDLTGWLIMLPTIILFAFFVWEPLLESIRLSLYSAKGIRLEEFVGFNNYKLVLNHPDFMAAFGNTFKYILW